MDRPALAEDPRFRSLATQKENEDALDAAIGEWTASLDKWECAAELQRVGVAASPVENLREMMEVDPILSAHYQVVHQPGVPDVDIPIDLELARWVGADHILRRAPGFGEHNEEIARKILGLSDDE
jgi:crotonobetainyl-CoA:carnitine CoA-transferase CaiB-like acyl-CoA transferase